MRAQSTDGGTALFLKSAGRFRYYGVFSKSEAVRAGVNDLSVLVQRQDKGTVMNATVLLHLEQTESSGDIRRIGSSLKYSGNFHVTSGAMPPKTGLKRNLSLMSLKVAGSFLPILDWLILNKKC